MLLRCLTIAASFGVLLHVAPVEQTQNIEDKITTGTNPPGLSFVLTTRNGQKLFHLGEVIEIEEDYSSSIPSQYSLLQTRKKLKGDRRPVSQTCPSRKESNGLTKHGE